MSYACVDKVHSLPKVHFCGIGGLAMLAGARLALEAKWEVRGSDGVLYPPASEMVQDLGVIVAEGYDVKNLDWNPDLVVIGNALSRGNQEVEEILRRKMKYVSLPEWLKETVLRQRFPVVISGTHGKTTTAALTAYLLERTGHNPGFLIGGQPLDFRYSSRIGEEGKPFVIEGDEYDTAFFDKRAKFFHYLPNIAVVTSIEHDHSDIYDSVTEIETAFRLMLRQISDDGWLVVCADNDRARKIAEHAFCNVATYGFTNGVTWRGEMTGMPGGFNGLTVFRENKRWAELAVPLTGRHNLQNALAAVAVAGILGSKPSDIQEAIMKFRGVRRRMEVFLDAWGMSFVDDFAHHPTAIRETIAAARTRWNGRVIVLLEPRSNSMVRNIFQDELNEALSDADIVWMGPLYREERISASERLDRRAVAEKLNKSGVEAHWSNDVEEIVQGVLAVGRAGDVVLILSNGAFGGIYRRLREIAGKNG